MSCGYVTKTVSILTFTDLNVKFGGNQKCFSRNQGSATFAAD